jgi:hypothetical protein
MRSSPVLVSITFVSPLKALSRLLIASAKVLMIVVRPKAKSGRPPSALSELFARTGEKANSALHWTVLGSVSALTALPLTSLLPRTPSYSI